MVEFLIIRLNKSNNQKLVYIPKNSFLQAGDIVKVEIVARRNNEQNNFKEVNKYD